MNKSDISRNQWMLTGPLAKKGYDWWWHSFTAFNEQTGEAKPFYIEFFTCNPSVSNDEVKIIWNNDELIKQHKKPSYVMVNVGYWGVEHGQLHNFYPWKDVEINKGFPYYIRCNDCECSETYTKGSVSVTEEEVEKHPEWMCDAGCLSWDLKINKQIAFHVGYGASLFFRKINAFEMFWHAEGMKTCYDGYVILNGTKYIVSKDTCNGYADKNWGGDFTSPWVWLSSNNLVSNLTGKKLTNSVFNIGGGRPKIYFLPLNRKLLGEFYYEGKDYEFNFSKFWTLSKTKFNSYETDEEIVWDVTQTTSKYILVTHVTCKKSDMLNINYEAPTGLKRHNKLWNGGNGVGNLKLYRKHLFKKPTLIDDVNAVGIGCEYGEYDK